MEMPDVDVNINENAEPDKRSYRVDFSRYRELAPGILPRVDLAQSIRELKAGLEAMGFNNHDFRNSDYMRLKVLTGLRADGRLNENMRWHAGDAQKRYH